MSDLLTRSRQYLDDEQYQEALATLQEGAESPTPDWYSLKGRALSGLHRWEEAMEAFRGALQADPDCSEALTGVALLQFLSGDLQTALTNLDEAVEKAPQEGRPLALRGMVKAQMGRTEQALDDLETAYQKGDRDPAHIQARAQILIAAGRTDEVEAVLQQASEAGADLNSLTHLRASLCLAKGDGPGALAHYRQATVDAPLEPQNWWHLLGLVSQLERNKLGQELDRAREHHPDDERILVLAAARYREEGQLRQAIALLNEAYDRQKDSLVLLEMLGDYLRDAGDLENSLEHFQEALKLAPDSARAHFGIGLATDGARESLDSFRRAVASEPDNAVYQYHLGAVLSSLGAYQEALGPLGKAIDLDEKFWRAYQERAICHENLDSFGRAARDREKAEVLKAEFS